MIPTHLVSPRFALFTLDSGFGFSWGAITAKILSIWERVEAGNDVAGNDVADLS